MINYIVTGLYKAVARLYPYTNLIWLYMLFTTLYNLNTSLLQGRNSFKPGGFHMLAASLIQPCCNLVTTYITTLLQGCSKLLASMFFWYGTLNNTKPCPFQRLHACWGYMLVKSTCLVCVYVLMLFTHLTTEARHYLMLF